MRLAGVASTGMIAERLKAMRAVEDFFVSPVLQETALNVVTSTGWPRHLRALRTELASRQSSLRAALADLAHPDAILRGGPMHVWLRLPSGLDAVTVRDAALRRGVSVVAGNQWHPSDQRTDHIRLSNASATLPDIVEGVERLRRAMSDLVAGSRARLSETLHW
ncbi:MAG: hypothetical protein R2710_06505 [Acidimicrobiales bacterium]